MKKHTELKTLYQIKIKEKEIKQLNKLLNRKEQQLNNKLLILLLILGFLLGKIINLRTIIQLF